MLPFDFDVFSSIWLIVDMVLDCITTASFGRDPDSRGFFIASIIVMLLPAVVGGIVFTLVLPCIAWASKDGGDECGCRACCVGCCCFPCIGSLSILIFFFIWVISPILQFTQAMFAAFGVKPKGGDTESKMQVKTPRSLHK